MRFQQLRIVLVCMLAPVMVTAIVRADTPRLTKLQDEPVDLPAENKALFAASREVSIQLDLLAAIPDTNFDETVVTVVRPNGQVTDLATDADGKVTLAEVEAGPHAIVASGKNHHGSTLVYLEEKPAADAPPPASEAPVRMTLLEVSPRELTGLVRNDLNLDSSPAEFVKHQDVRCDK